MRTGSAFSLSPLLRGPSLIGVSRDPLGVPIAFARLANTCPVLFEANILVPQRVAFKAFRLLCILRSKPNAAQRVFPLGHWLKMIWVNAAPGAAKVIKGQGVRDFGDQRFVTKAMGSHGLLPRSSKFPVPLQGGAAHPNPASAFRDFDKGEKSLQYRSNSRATLFHEISVPARGVWASLILARQPGLRGPTPQKENQ